MVWSHDRPYRPGREAGLEDVLVDAADVSLAGGGGGAG